MGTSQSSELTALEEQLDSFDGSLRARAARDIAAVTDFPEPRRTCNMHLHSFYSYNAHGYSPSHLAYIARREGFCASGMVDFDVLDGLEECYAAGKTFGIPVAAGVESRVFVPEFADCEINSPGEPGIAYHIGIGIPHVPAGGFAADFLDSMRETAASRTQALLQRVNDFLTPVTLDFDTDVRPLTPAGNATERHLCHAFARKAAEQFPDEEELAEFWEKKLGVSRGDMDLPSGSALQDMIRKKTMKRGGVGYVAPDQGSFPLMADMNRFVLEAGGIPVIAWLDGTTSGEQDMERLCKTAMQSGAAALNIIPARNYTPGVKDEKLENLYAVVRLCRELGLPVLAGTEMNSPSNKLENDFRCDELKPLWPDFYEGAMVAVAHAAMQRCAGIGYESDWAASRFTRTTDKKKFYADVGARLSAHRKTEMPAVTSEMTPDEILNLNYAD